MVLLLVPLTKPVELVVAITVIGGAGAGVVAGDGADGTGHWL